MTKYRILEYPDGKKGFCPRGAAKTLWQSRDHETIIAGPAETGKTWACCQYIDALLWKYPGAQGVMVRKVYNSIIGSALRTYQRVINHPSTPIKPYGGERPTWYDYPNGSRLWIIGLDHPEKALSSERDFFYVNQTEELTLNDWEMLATRCTGRGAVMPYTRMIGDANPGPPNHWILHRSGLRVLHSRHEDNPTLYGDDGSLTPQGTRTMAVLDSLTGVRKERLRYGRWVAAEGLIYTDWNPEIHLVPRRPIPDSWPRYWSIDFGYTNPFVWLCWAVDEDGRLWLLRQLYMSQRLVEDHARRILELASEELEPAQKRDLAPTDRLGPYAPKAIICDHDAEDRATLERHLRMPTIPAAKNISLGIQAVAGRLRAAGDGKPRLFVLRDSLDERDPSLEAEKRPCCFEEEIPSYIWKPRPSTAASDMKNAPDEPIDRDNHGCDAVRYMVAHFERWANGLPSVKEMGWDEERERSVGLVPSGHSNAAARGWYGRGGGDEE